LIIRKINTIESDIRAEAAAEMQAQLAQVHQSYEACINEQVSTTQKRYQF
jgi:hypothetical protein